MNKSKFYFLTFSTLLLFAPFAGGESPWSFANRLQFAQEYDSNVEESLHNEQQATASRMVFQTKMKRTGRRSNLSLGYLGGLSLCNSMPSENKLINESYLRTSFNLNSHLQIGANGFGRLKLFLNKETDYAFGSIQPFIRYTLGAGWRLKAGYENESLDYARSHIYDFNVDSWFVSFSRRLSNGVTLGLAYSHKTFQYDRLTTVLNLEFSSFSENQQDLTDQFSLFTDFILYGWLINLSYYFETNNSNSYGFSYNRHLINLIAAREIKSFLLRGYVTIQKKNYSDDFLPSWPIELDSEREQSNFAVLDISRDLTATLTAMLRAAWYRNESPWASLYYNKTVLSAGLELRFPSR